MTRLQYLSAFTLLLAACSSQSASNGTDAVADAVDATAPMDQTPADVSPIDRPTTDAPTVDVPPRDTPTTDAPTTDVQRTDVPTTDASTLDAPAPDASADADCQRPDVIVLDATVECRGGAPCPAGYECLAFEGVVLQEMCGRSCRSDCDCPATQICGSYTDKAGRHPLCVAR